MGWPGRGIVVPPIALGLDFRQRDIRLFLYQTPDQFLMCRQREVLVAAKLRRPDANPCWGEA
jgi:hypothetical protein